MNVRFTSASIIILAAVCISACGGGTNSSPASSPNVTQELAKSVSANTSTVPSEAVAAQAEMMSTTQAVVAGAQANQTYNCLGGGTAVYQVTGPVLSQLTNGQLDAGENYTLTFNACKGALGAVSINGALNLSVASASVGNLTVNSSTNGLVVTRPRGTLTLNGSSSLQMSIVAQGADVTTTTHWTTPNYSVTTAYNSRSSSFSLSNVDITDSVTSTNGVISRRTHSGTTTLSATLPNGAFTVTTATQGAVTYNAAGTPTQGSWSVTLPNNRITLSVAAGSVTLGVDYGANGTVDMTYTLTITELEAEAG
jgi:galactitol-specific phosphotransferase system IIB component